jgi:hypothetical protein
VYVCAPPVVSMDCMHPADTRIVNAPPVGSDTPEQLDA